MSTNRSKVLEARNSLCIAVIALGGSKLFVCVLRNCTLIVFCEIYRYKAHPKLKKTQEKNKFLSNLLESEALRSSEIPSGIKKSRENFSHQRPWHSFTVLSSHT